MAELVRNFPTGEGTDVAPSPGARPLGSGIESQSQSQLPQGQGPTDQGASGLTEQAKDLVSQQVSQRAGRSADDINEVARALRQTREQLGGNVAAPYVDKAAQQLERLSSFLRTADANQVVRGVESFARREPLLFLGGAFVLGIVAARFLKSSARETSEWSEREGRRSFVRDPRPVTHEQYPYARTEPRGDISHSAEGPASDYVRGPGGGL